MQGSLYGATWVTHPLYVVEQRDLQEGHEVSDARLVRGGYYATHVYVRWFTIQ